MNWNTLQTVEELDYLDALSEAHPVLIFKHSTRCSISAATLSRLERHWDASKTGQLTVYYLDILQHRAISDEIARRYGVTHESPQALLISGGKSIYHASHFGISFAELINHLETASV